MATSNNCFVQAAMTIVLQGTDNVQVKWCSIKPIWAEVSGPSIFRTHNLNETIKLKRNYHCDCIAVRGGK